MFHTQINGTIVTFMEKSTFKAHVDFCGSVPLRLGNHIYLFGKKKFSGQGALLISLLPFYWYGNDNPHFFFCHLLSESKFERKSNNFNLTILLNSAI